MVSQRLDIIIFGATGFTGKYTVKKAALFAKDYNLSWGIAGRRQEALEKVIQEFSLESENIPIIIADVKNGESLKRMTEQAKVLVNCCGPYIMYGESVVKACIATNTHHVDVSGEPLYMESIQLLYNKAAQEAGIYIISACGFDSIPCDIGVLYTKQQFEGELNSIETYLKYWSRSQVKGVFINYGTWESAIHHLADKESLCELRQKLATKLPDLKPKLKRKGMHSRTNPRGWSAVFIGPDRSVCYRSQHYLYEKCKQRPIQIRTYIVLGSIFRTCCIVILGIMILTLGRFNHGRRLLLKHPTFFSGGYASYDGPNTETMENTHFSITLKASGWSEKLTEPTDSYKDPPNKKMITKVSGVNPVYGITSVALLASAMTILTESDKMPDRGGVFTPGAAFHNTSIIDLLSKYNIKFEVVSSK